MHTRVADYRTKTRLQYGRDKKCIGILRDGHESYLFNQSTNSRELIPCSKLVGVNELFSLILIDQR